MMKVKHFFLFFDFTKESVSFVNSHHHNHHNHHHHLYHHDQNNVFTFLYSIADTLLSMVFKSSWLLIQHFLTTIKKKEEPTRDF